MIITKLSSHYSSNAKSPESPKERKEKVKLFSRVRLFGTPRTVAYQAPLSMGFSRQEHWSGSPPEIVTFQVSNITFIECNFVPP